MNNIYGFSSFTSGGNSDGGGSNPLSNPDIYAINDLHITTAPDKNIYINNSKTNLNQNDGDVIFNYSTTNANVVVANGDLEINNGDLDVLDIFGRNETLSGVITSPTISTSATNFSTPTTIPGTCVGIPISYPTPTTTSSGFSGFTYTQLNAPPDTPSQPGYIAQVQIPAGVQAEVMVQIPVQMQWALDIPGYTVNSNNVITYKQEIGPLVQQTSAAIPDNPPYPFMNNTWYRITSTTNAYIQQESSPGSGVYNPFYSSIYWQNIGTENTYAGALIKTSVDSPIATSGTGVTYQKNVGIFVYKFYTPLLAVATNYRLMTGCNMNSYIISDSGALPYNSNTATQMNPNNLPLNFTYSNVNIVAPINTAIGTTMVNALSYQTMIPRFNTGYFAVTTSTTYTIVHNLNIPLGTPYNLVILYSYASTAANNQTNITSQVYTQAAAGVVGAYTWVMTDPNTVTISTTNVSVGIAADASGTIQNRTGGYWNVFIY